MRKSEIWLLLTLVGFGLLGWSLVHTRYAADQAGDRLEHSRQLVTRLGLTDLSLFTEARYTRHPSQADRHSAFQDHPMALEHFPSGSLVIPGR